jgi:predicted enzyme related to lactoylglutathione lyase
MADGNEPAPGTIGWVDLTVENAEEVRDFYKAVCGWKTSPVSMGDYDDWCMNRPDTGEAVAGVCHRRGTNADLPSQWLVYVTVPDARTAAEHAVENGGEIVAGPRAMGHGVIAVVRDPAGAVLALYQP